MRHFGAVLVLLLLTGGYAVLHPPVNLAIGRGVLRAMPATIGEWNGTELSFEDAVVEELRSDDLLIRRYQRADDLVWLCVVYHQNRRYGAHEPQLCYESQGYVVEHRGTAAIPDGTPGGLAVNTFIADSPRHRRLVWYWWTTDGLATSNVAEWRRRMALAGALENRSWGAFVRIETPVIGGDDAAAARRLEDFGTRVALDLPAVFTAATPGAARP